ncbi:hypothetical protein ANCDUO_08124 [Ancylostoma duodenale]|uniref:Uncharacterized protein n=1 Tax=Ancylostoma duodenale TaxID=51022 RepID=A0A0C2CX73_9BILA|nr:hypothetical protein ANCDUO_08124 [Ancylostoma duodenale]
MAPTLKPSKTRLTKTKKTVDELIRDSQSLTAFTLPTLDSAEETVDFLKGRKATLAQRISDINQATASLKTAMSCFEKMFEKISPEDQAREQSSYEEYLRGTPSQQQRHYWESSWRKKLKSVYASSTERNWS